MISHYVQEQHRYTPQELYDLLNLSEEKAIPVLKRLKTCNIVKAVKANDIQQGMTELADSDVAVVDVNTGDHDVYYVFTFVGVITIAGRILKCYPKYLPTKAAPVNEMRQIIKVLEKYNSREQIVHMFTEDGGAQSFNLLAVMLALLTDYHEYGVYSNTQDVIEVNGAGEILWDRTINETYAILSEGRPYYTELQTMHRVQDEFDFFRRLHECVLTTISKELNQTELPELFDIATVDLSDELLDDLGDADYILTRIEKELNVEFNTRKQLVLKTIYAYISRIGHLADEDCFALFGTNSFNLVWERVCSEILNNQLYTPLGSLRLPVPLRPGYDRRMKLIDLIEKPVWSGDGFRHEASETLIPDLITIDHQYGHSRFLIFDAKYYVAQLEKNKPLRGQPGIESVTKQYLYQLAYQRFIREHEFSEVCNCFLLPTAGDGVIDAGTASLPMLDGLGLQHIQVRFIPARRAFADYLDGLCFDISEMNI